MSDRRTAEGRPLVLHHIGGGVVEEDRLVEFRITGQYRMTQGNGLTGSGMMTYRSVN